MEGPDTKKANKEYILKNKKKRTLERKRGKEKKKPNYKMKWLELNPDELPRYPQLIHRQQKSTQPPPHCEFSLSST
jgi:hypothetical protein